MKGRGKEPPSTDLLDCFPSRAHLTLIPKPISPAKPQEPNKHQHHRRRLKKSIHGNKVVGHGSPVPWAQTKSYGKEMDEPTSPKVTCAGQIKVKSKPSSCRNWQSVMEEIERLHNHRKNKKRLSWVEAFGFKKDVLQFLTCLRSLRSGFRCFGAFRSSSSIISDEEDDGGDESKDNHEMSEASRTLFSKWFMVLQEYNTGNKELIINRDTNFKLIRDKFSFSHDFEEKAVDDDDQAPCAPPPNALLLMRCRSAPAKNLLQGKGEDEEEERSHYKNVVTIETPEREEERAMKREKKRKQNLIVMRCGADSSDMEKETWVVGGIKESISRSRSWKR